jgi:hypothetical protein
MRPLKSFSYINSITKFEHLVDVEDLETAYGRAGTSSNGQLQQNFVVLNERDQASLQSVMGSGTGSGPSSGATRTSYRGSGPRGRAGHSGGYRGRGESRGEKRAGTPLESTSHKK